MTTSTPLTPATESPSGRSPHEPEHGRFHPFGRSTAEDIALLRAGEETGWWDESGAPAPWPQDFLDPAASWSDGHGPHDPDTRMPPTLTDAPAPF